jgi:hypothetical protein
MTKQIKPMLAEAANVLADELSSTKSIPLEEFRRKALGMGFSRIAVASVNGEPTIMTRDFDTTRLLVNVEAPVLELIPTPMAKGGVKNFEVVDLHKQVVVGIQGIG